MLRCVWCYGSGGGKVGGVPIWLDCTRLPFELHFIHTRFPGPTRARPAMAALSPRTDGSPSLLAATSTAQKLAEARAQLETKASKMPTISTSPQVPRAQPSSPVDIEACGTTKRKRTREGRRCGRGWGPRACRILMVQGLERTCFERAAEPRAVIPRC